MKFGLYPVRPGEGKDLSIEVVDRGGKKQQGTNGPSVLGCLVGIFHRLFYWLEKIIRLNSEDRAPARESPLIPSTAR